jgi:hypothetical protein
MDVQDYAYNQRLLNDGEYNGPSPARGTNRFGGGDSLKELCELADKLAVQQARLDGYTGTDEEIRSTIVAEREQASHEQFLRVSQENAELQEAGY